MKIRRYAESKLKKKINAIFSGLMFLVMILSFRQSIWESKAITYIDGIIGITILLVIFTLILKNYHELKNVIMKTFEKRKSILESITLTSLLLISAFYTPVLLIYFVLIMIAIAKEAFLMSPSIAETFNKNE